MKPTWAFSSATVRTTDWPEEFALLRRFRWKAVHLWYDKMKGCLEKGATCDELGRQLHDAGIEPVGLAPGVVWTPSTGHDPRLERDELLQRMDVAVALGAPSLSVAAVGKTRGDLAVEYRHLADKLRGVAELAEARGLRLNLEFIAGADVVGTMGSCMELIAMIDHPAVGMVLDVCHYYASASHVEELARLPKGRLFLVHVGDVPDRPMEALSGEHRCFPGDGRIAVADLVREIHKRTRYKGPWCLELVDRDIWAMDAHDVFKKASAALKKVEKQLA